MADSVRLGPQDDLGLSVALRALASSSGKWVSSGPQSLHHPNQHLLKGQLPSGGTWREWGPPPAKQGCLGDLHPESTPGMPIRALPSRATSGSFWTPHSYPVVLLWQGAHRGRVAVISGSKGLSTLECRNIPFYFHVTDMVLDAPLGCVEGG